MFTRRLEDVTEQFPEVSDMVKKAVSAKTCILEGEMIGFDPKTGDNLPFQFLSQRIKRKYDIGKIQKQIPVRIRLFDMVFLEGKVLFDLPLKERWSRLNQVFKPIGEQFRVADHIESSNLKEMESFSYV